MRNKLELKTRLKQLLGCVPLVIALPGCSNQQQVHRLPGVLVVFDSSAPGLEKVAPKSAPSLNAVKLTPMF
jgi:hypothetical protein